MSTLETLDKALNISTHTPLAGRDLFQPLSAYSNFNSHAPCGARPPRRKSSAPLNQFQLTRPLRGATPWGRVSQRAERFQLTRPLRGATCGAVPCRHAAAISTHTPLAGRDRIYIITQIWQFVISTHTPLAGRDNERGCSLWKVLDFNSHAPCGARRM